MVLGVTSDKEKAPKRWVLPSSPVSVCHGWWRRRGLEEAEKKEQLGEGSHFRKQQQKPSEWEPGVVCISALAHTFFP